MKRSDPNRFPPNTLEQKRQCIKQGNPFYYKYKELCSKQKTQEKEKNTPQE